MARARSLALGGALPSLPPPLSSPLQVDKHKPSRNLTLLNYGYRGAEVSKVLTRIQLRVSA
jgi:hypothetical protein